MTGAAILVALVVLVVPELLSGPRHPARALPAVAGEPPVRTYTLPLVEGATGAGERAAAASGAVPEPDGTAALRDDDSAQGPPPPPASTVGAARVSEAPATQMGTARVASTPPASMRGAQAAAVSAVHASARGTPAASGPGVQAPAARSLRPESPSGERTSAARGAKALTRGWSVQLGSFSDRSNAERLAHALKRKGYGAFVSEISSRGRKWYRVRVGPERDRAAAAAVAGRLRAAGHAGEIIPPR